MKSQIGQANSRAMSARRLVMAFCIGGALLLPPAVALPQNPFETFAAGALSLASSAAEMLQNGARAEHEGGFETPLFSVRSRKEVGMGQAMRRRSDDSSEEDSDEDRRRKRALASTEELSPHSHLLRNKRSPCHSMRPSTSGGGTGGTADGGDADGIEEVRRRMARMQARKRSANSKKTQARNAKTKAKTTAKKAKKNRRRRRQTEVDDLAGEMQNAGNQLGGQFTEKVRGIFQSIFNAMNQVVQQMKQVFSGGGIESGQNMVNDAENI